MANKILKNWQELLEQMSNMKDEDTYRMEDHTGSYIIMREETFNRIFTKYGHKIKDAKLGEKE